MPAATLLSSLLPVPPGAYAVGVSGGADSVALLHLLRHARADLSLHVVHLDHQTRGAESAADAAFVGALAASWGLPHTTARRKDVERDRTDWPRNKSARFRVLRHHLFRRVVDEHRFRGVLLAHHADDQAETVLHRLLRGSRAPYLAGMSAESRLPGLVLFRPLLHTRRRVLRDYLVSVEQPWREDASNASPDYFRNRLRLLLSSRPELVEALLGLHDAFVRLRAWTRAAAPALPASFPIRRLNDLPDLLADESARRWLEARGVPVEEVLPAVVSRLFSMAADAASPPASDFPGGLRVRRRKGIVSGETKRSESE